MSNSLQRIRHATPAELRRAADVDLWRGGTAGARTRFDADRFGEWLEILVDAGSEITTRQLAAMDADLVIVGVAEHVRVFDGASRPARERPDEVELGGYIIVPRTGRSCQAVLDTLAALHDENPPFFHRVMAGCRRLSNEGFEVDGLHDLLGDREQALLDLTLAREQRREQEGYVSAADARAFLSGASESRRALFRAHRRERVDAPSGDQGNAVRAAMVSPVEDDDIAAPRALLGSAREEPARVLRLQALLRGAAAADAAAFAARVEELGFVANALAAGCTVQDRALAPSEAADAAAAVCNLALENRADASHRYLVDHDCLNLFDEGWQLYRGVCLETGNQLLETLDRIECHDAHVQRGLDALRRTLTRHQRQGAPWHARPALDVLTALDLPSWAALLGLIAECPVVHAAIPAIVERRRGAIDPKAFEFISETRHVAMVRQFLSRLPDLLTGV